MLLTIHDDGQGFDPATSEKDWGFQASENERNFRGACSIEPVKGAEPRFVVHGHLIDDCGLMIENPLNSHC